jgi:molecular chaperone GrpE
MKSKTKKAPEILETTGDELLEQITVLDQNWKRALADYQNLVKRTENEKKEIMRFASTNVVSRLIPSLDILEMAASHSQDPGVNMAVKQFQQVLKEEGLEEIIPAENDPYDHTIHECIEVLPGNTDNTVAQVLIKGYKIGDYIIRPAKVKVWQKS